MLILLRFMETHGVALGYVGDKIRYILIIRVRFTTEFFFSNTDLSDWRGYFALGGTVFQTAVTICHGNPDTSSRVTLAALGIVFQTKLVATETHLYNSHLYQLQLCIIYTNAHFCYWWLPWSVPARFGWKPIPSEARVTRDEVSGL